MAYICYTAINGASIAVQLRSEFRGARRQKQREGYA